MRNMARRFQRNAVHISGSCFIVTVQSIKKCCTYVCHNFRGEYDMISNDDWWDACCCPCIWIDTVSKKTPCFQASSMFIPTGLSVALQDARNSVRKMREKTKCNLVSIKRLFPLVHSLLWKYAAPKQTQPYRWTWRSRSKMKSILFDIHWLDTQDVFFAQQIHIFFFWHIYIFTYSHFSISANLHVYIFTDLNKKLHKHLHIHIYIFENLHLPVHIHIYIFTHLQLNIHIAMFA